MREDFILEADPLVQFRRWFKDASASDEPQPEAMVLATANVQGQPSARVVLYKGVEAGGIVFFANYQSAKAADLAENASASLLFFWPTLLRQVRLAGRVERLPAKKSAAYFQSRPRESQIGAWASPQSQVIDDREFLEKRFNEVSKEFENKEIPCPDFWGGYVLIPERWEFWLGREHRLHDRFCYQRKDSNWERYRLAP